jgi:hypothetical protein
MTRDWVLVEWAAMANRNQLRDVSLTFQCGGLVLCGTLISEREYFEGIGALAVEGMRAAQRPPEVADAFASLYRKHADRSATATGGADQEGDEPAHLHLKDAHVLCAGPGGDLAAALDVPYWRAKIEAVDGCLLGAAVQHLPRSSALASGDEDPREERED